jgi:3-hydroxyacyl-CoA dehydrogenase
MPRRIGVVGPGAIGGRLAERLNKAGHEVSVIATERTAVTTTENAASPLRLSSQALARQTPHEQLETFQLREIVADRVDHRFVSEPSGHRIVAVNRGPDTTCYRAITHRI